MGKGELKKLRGRQFNKASKQSHQKLPLPGTSTIASEESLSVFSSSLATKLAAPARQTRNSRDVLQIGGTQEQIHSQAAGQFKTSMDFFHNRYLQSPTSQASQPSRKTFTLKQRRNQEYSAAATSPFQNHSPSTQTNNHHMPTYHDNFSHSSNAKNTLEGVESTSREVEIFDQSPSLLKHDDLSQRSSNLSQSKLNQFTVVGATGQSRVAHKRNKAKLQVNNFLDSVPVDSDQ